jgi:predicted nuclease of predicted toxin-antitoxin system
MKVVVDENVPPSICKWFRARGIDATSVLDCGLHGAKDGDITRFALDSQRVVLTRDKDFDEISARTSLRVIRLDVGNMDTQTLMKWLDGHELEIRAGLKAKTSLTIIS